MATHKWIDVATTALPRLLTEQGIGSLLDMMDATGYRLRWVFHLDVLPWMKDSFRENMQQAERLAHRFDDAVLMPAVENQAYGGACYRVLSEIHHDVLWCEDDRLWVKACRLADVEGACRDGFYFHRPNAIMGSTSPSFWRRRVAQHLLEHFPQPKEQASESDFQRILHWHAGFRANRSMGLVPRRPTVSLTETCPFSHRWVGIMAAYNATWREQRRSIDAEARCVVVRSRDEAAASNVDVEPIDLVVIHTEPIYEVIAAALRNWWPRIRPGGMMAGHDYRGKRNRRNKAAVSRAVKQFGARHQMEVHAGQHMTWWIRKPGGADR